jgi:hypothetical protein
LVEINNTGVGETTVLRAVYFESNDAESEEVTIMSIEAPRCTQNLLLSDQDTKFARCRPIGVGHKWGVDEVGQIGNGKSASVYRWRELAIAIAASA